jgi:hypothetical protein
MQSGTKEVPSSLSWRKGRGLSGAQLPALTNHAGECHE